MAKDVYKRQFIHSGWKMRRVDLIRKNGLRNPLAIVQAAFFMRPYW